MPNLKFGSSLKKNGSRIRRPNLEVIRLSSNTTKWRPTTFYSFGHYLYVRRKSEYSSNMYAKIKAPKFLINLINQI